MTSSVVSAIRAKASDLTFETRPRDAGQIVHREFAEVKVRGRWYDVRRVTDRSDGTSELAARLADSTGAWTSIG